MQHVFDLGRVIEFVPLQVGVPGEPFPTHAAVMRLLARVNMLVSQEAAVSGETLPTR